MMTIMYQMQNINKQIEFIKKTQPNRHSGVKTYNNKLK